MKKCIVYTRFGGDVAIYYPAPACLSTMSSGGWWDQFPLETVRQQVARQVQRGIPRWAAMRYFEAMGDGGLDEHDALLVLRDRDCSYLGTGHEVWPHTEVPKDRWFRDAWGRSHNGGPIYVEMRKARSIHWKRLKRAAEKAEIQLGRWRDRIHRAETPDELRLLWPRGLKRSIVITSCTP